MNSKRLIVIPARSGSKRIANKNIQPFLKGNFLLNTINLAKSTFPDDIIVVSSESEQYLQIAIDQNVNAFKRLNFFDDHSPVSLATLNVLEKYKHDHNLSCVIQLMPNCPFRTSDTLLHCLTEFNQGNGQSIISGSNYLWTNPLWSYYLTEDNIPVPLYEETEQYMHKKQNLICPSGSVWISNIENLISSQTFYSIGWRFSLLSWLECFDIDTPEEYEFARKLEFLIANQ